MKKWILLALVLFIFLVPVKSTYATPSSYTYIPNLINLYSDNHFYAEFSGLDTSTNYQFDLQRLNWDGNVVETLASFFTFGVATATISFDDWPQNDNNFPFQIVDQFGQILSKHVLLDANTKTQLATVALSYDAIQILNKEVTTLPYDSDCDCTNPFNNPEYVTFNLNNKYLVIHYAISSATIGDTLVLNDMFDGTAIFTMDVADIYNYNDIGTGLSDGAEAAYADLYSFNNFIVISLDGITPPFQVASRIANVFVNGDRPDRITIPIGVYDYAITLSGTTNAGQSPLFISNRTSGSEWQYNLLSRIQPEKEQKVTVTQKTSEIFTVYNNIQFLDLALSSVSDQSLGLLSSAYSDANTFSYTVSPIPSTFVITQLYTQPEKSNYETELTTSGRDLQSYAYYIESNYKIVELADIADNIIQKLKDANFWDAGSQLFILACMTVLMMYLSEMWHFNTIAKVIVYTGFAIAMIFMPYWTTIVKILLGISIPFVWLFTVKVGIGGNNEE